MGWNRSRSDRGGRFVQLQTFAGAGLPAPWGANAAGTGTVTTSYDANLTTVTDQTSRQRQSEMDGLGRLIKVYEAPNDSNFNFLTSYGYNALGNLTAVTQGSQSRSFVYDSLGRLTSATNPESG